MRYGYVYLLHSWDDDTYKIGITINPDIKGVRVKHLQTGNPSEITVIHKYKCENYRKVETMLHNYYTTSHKRGEWFKLSIEQANAFIEKCEYFDKCVKLLLKENPFYK